MSKLIWLAVITFTNNLFLLANTHPSKLEKVQDIFSESQAIINATIAKAELYCGAKVIDIFVALIVLLQLRSLFSALKYFFDTVLVCLLFSVYCNHDQMKYTGNNIVRVYIPRN